MNLKAVVGFVVVTIGILLGVGGLLWQFGSNADKPITDIAGESRHLQGKGSVIIVEFSDFQCPACFNVQEPLTKILKKFEGKITFVYRYFPLITIHKNAQISAQAAEAAGIQGKFWEMHDKLFSTQNIWEGMADPKETFIGYAKELELDINKFVNEIDSQKVRDAVNNDSQDATRFKISGTPTFYVNGIKTEFGKIEGKIEELTK